MRGSIVLHNKTQRVADEDLPYNPKNVALQLSDVRAILDAHGLTDVAVRDLSLYRTAFVHKSYVVMKKDDAVTGNERCPTGCLPLQEVSYERLEFLGDAVLSCAVAQYTYARFPTSDEGFLTRVRTKIVNGRALAALARALGFGKWLLVSKQIEEGGGRGQVALLEDCFEAFVGAIATDQSDVAAWHGGFDAAARFVAAVLERHIDFSELVAPSRQAVNAKEALVNYMRYAQRDAPRFELCGGGGGTTIDVCVKDRAGAVLGIGHGLTRKDAEAGAAAAALAYYGKPWRQTDN